MSFISSDYCNSLAITKGNDIVSTHIRTVTTNVQRNLLMRSEEKKFNFYEKTGSFNFLQSERKYTGNYAYRANSRLRKLLMKNLTKRSYFCTFTFEIEPVTFEDLFKDMSLWLRRIREKSGNRIKVLWVPELGEVGGRFHAHAIVTGDYRGKENLVKKEWHNGICDTKRISKGTFEQRVGKVAHYITKYITKDGAKIEGRTRSYYISKNWNGEILKAYMNGAQQKRFCSEIENLRRKLKIKAPKVSRIEIGMNAIMQYMYYSPKLDEKTVIAVLKKCDIPFYYSNIMNRQAAEKELAEFQDALQDYAIRCTCNEDNSKALQVLYNRLPKALTPDEKMDFIKAYRKIQTDTAFVLDPVRYSNADECRQFVYNPKIIFEKENAVWKVRSFSTMENLCQSCA